MRKNPDNRSRLFSKKSYGYVKTSDKKEIEGFYPNDSGIDISGFLTSGKPDSKIQNAFNVEQLALESGNLRNRISQSKSILNYIDRKQDIRKDDIKLLKRAKIKEKNNPGLHVRDRSDPPPRMQFQHGFMRQTQIRLSTNNCKKKRDGVATGQDQVSRSGSRTVQAHAAIPVGAEHGCPSVRVS